MPGFIRKIVFGRLIIAGFILFTAGAFLTGGFFPFDVRDFYAGGLMNWCIFAAIRDAGAILITAGAIISGLRSIQTQGSNRRRIAMVLAGIAIGLLFLSLNSIAAIQMGNLLKSYDFGRMIALIEFKLKQENLSSDKRHLLMLKLAESRYLQGGERILVSTADNQRELYNPPQATVNFKKDVDFSRQMYGLIRQWSYYSIYVWVAVLLFSTIAGAISPES